MSFKSYRIVDTMAKDQARNKPCVICARFGAESYCLINKKDGGHDLEFNIMPLCNVCRSIVGRLGLAAASKKYKQVENWLLSYGWQFNEILQRWKHEQ